MQEIDFKGDCTCQCAIMLHIGVPSSPPSFIELRRGKQLPCSKDSKKLRSLRPPPSLCELWRDKLRETGFVGFCALKPEIATALRASQ